MDDLIRLSRKAANEWRNSDAYYQASVLIDSLCDRLEDSVPVVRCKDCKHYQTDDWDGDTLCGCTLHSAMLDITPDSFCSYGERKDGDG